MTTNVISIPIRGELPEESAFPELFPIERDIVEALFELAQRGRIKGSGSNGTYLSRKRNNYGNFSERGDSVRYDKWPIFLDSRLY